MANYFIIGGDGKQYGPVTEAELRQWIAEGRLNGQSLAKAESDAEFRPLSLFPELADALSDKSVPGRIGPIKTAAGVSGEDYELDLGECFSRGWELVKKNLEVLFVGSLIYMLIEGAIGGFGGIPYIGPLFSLGNLIISGPLMGGVLYLFLRVLRGQPATVGNIFDGFRRSFAQLFLGTLAQGFLILLCMIPALVLLVIKLIPMAGQLQHLSRGTPPDASVVEAIKIIVLALLPVILLCLIPATYLGVCWKFTLPLIIDREMDFWTAMKTSFKRVNRHWWQVFGLMILLGLLNLAGLLACCIGILFTLPVSYAALMYAYETIFGPKES